jgi:hypothetical protein
MKHIKLTANAMDEAFNITNYEEEFWSLNQKT